MMAFVSELVGTQPILALFLAIGLGYAVGQINILGFSLGVGAVLFIGLFLGAIAPKAQIAGPIGLIGLIMFLYGIGILYGRQFFEGLSGPGRVYNLLSRRPKVLQQALQPEPLRGHASLAAGLLWRQRQEPFSCIVGQGVDGLGLPIGRHEACELAPKLI